MIKFIKSIQRKWLYSIVGLWTAFKEEKSLWAYMFVIPVIVTLGFIVDLSVVEWSIIVLTMVFVLTTEIINTALEAAVDTISFQYNVNVKKIKDIASGATFIATIGAVIILCIIFIPQIKELF